VALAAAIAAVGLLVAAFGYPLGPGTVRRMGFGLGPGIPAAAADYVEAQHLRGAVFNTYAAGAYLVYRFHPEVRVAMDSRNDVYGEALWDEYTRACASRDDLGTFLTRLDAGFAFLEWSQQGFTTTAAALRSLPEDWRPVYFDDQAAVYLAAGGSHADLASRDAYAILEPSLFRPGGWSPEEAARALPEADRAVARSRGAFIARVMRVEALRSLGRRDEADREEAGVVAADPPLFHIQILLGLAHAVRGETAPATARFRRALELNPASDAARQGLAMSEKAGTR
jgi:tetratricopeptide (TPR) repeat protein